MKKNKIIALVILAFLVLVPFQWAYIDFSVESQLSQVLTMTTVIIGAIIAILIFNQKTDESAH